MSEEQIEQILSAFREWAKEAGVVIKGHQIRYEILKAPHSPSALPPRCQGVYAFSFEGVWLKVGKAGPKSNARWVSQHYNPVSAMSNLARSLLRYAYRAESEEPRLPTKFKARIRAIDVSEIGTWIKRHTDRCNIILDAKLGRPPLDRLESIAHGVLDPLFEGGWKYGGPVL